MTVKEASEFIDVSTRTIYRYIKNGKLPHKLKQDKPDVKKRDLLVLASELHEKKDKHRPDTVNETLTIADPNTVKELIKSPSKPLLNDLGKKTLIETTKRLKATGLLADANKDSVLRYATAVQLYDLFTVNGHDTSEKYYFDLAKMQFDIIKHYEKELGLTPASLAKIKPKEKEETIDIDPMEAMLNGN